jgi:hypothetical protein
MRLIGLVLAAFVLVPQVLAQPSQRELRSQYEEVYFAWDSGDYLTALERARTLLTSHGGETYLRPIALLTGEVFPVAQIAAAGRNLSWSGDGRYIIYETGTGSEIMTHVVSAADLREVASLAAGGARFSPDGQHAAYLRVPETPELAAATEAERRAIAAGDQAGLRQARADIALVRARTARIVVRNVATGQETDRSPANFERVAVAFGGDGSLLLIGRPTGVTDRTDIYLIGEGNTTRPLTSGPGFKGERVLPAGERHLVYSIGNDSLGVVALDGSFSRSVSGTSPAVSRNGATLTYLTNALQVATEARRGEAVAGVDVRAAGGVNAVMSLALNAQAEPVEIIRTTLPIANPAVSPSGNRIAWQMILRDDWEIYVADVDGNNRQRLTREIQHDFFPQFVTDDKLIAMLGEARHRRAYLHDVTADYQAEIAVTTLPGRDQRGRTRLFHNNTVRTVAPQYEWVASPRGDRVLVAAHRDGNTLVPTWGIYVVDVDRMVSSEEVLARIDQNLAAERALQQRGQELFKPIEKEVRAAVSEVSVGRIYDHAHALSLMDSKWFSEPGNLLAVEYLAHALRQMGYEPELQWFDPRGTGDRSANVVATLRGTSSPEKIYVISSHFDSVPGSPGADDNSSGATALLEAARVLANRPQDATIQFAFLTAEEAGLRGAREFVRLAQERGDEIVGVINNDMVGWTRSHRLDNTIRYSNDEIRDIQHASAILFTNLITYDARYVRGTDAQVFFDTYGNILGGMGGYPILGNPHYHQPHDMLDTINHQLVAEVSRMTIGAIMRMATGPTVFVQR